eukprot:scaffold8178_cov49-Attheya_sp.AAC.1
METDNQSERSAGVNDAHYCSSDSSYNEKYDYESEDSEEIKVKATRSINPFARSNLNRRRIIVDDSTDDEESESIDHTISDFEDLHSQGSYTQLNSKIQNKKETVLTKLNEALDSLKITPNKKET